MHRPVAFACLLLCVACGKDVEDPSFSSASTTQTGGSSSGEEGDDGGTTTSGADTTASTTASTTATSADTGAESSSGGGDTTTGGAAETGNGSCGDGVISPGEQCDGADLQDFDCMSLGLSGGTLSCDPMTCTFDTSMCMSTSGGTSS